MVKKKRDRDRNQKKYDIIRNFSKKLIDSQKPLDPDFQKVVDDTFWELVDEGKPSTQREEGKMKSVMAKRRDAKALCPKCKSPDYKYNGRAYEPDGKHVFTCNSCGHGWQYGRTESKYTRLK